MGNFAKGLASGDVSSIIRGGVGMITNATKLFDFKTKKADKALGTEEYQWFESDAVVYTDCVGFGTGCQLLENVFMS